MGREIQRSYLPTPELLKDGVRISTVPINLAAGDWNGLNRLLETVRKAIIEPQGTITGRLFRTAVEPDKRVEIDTAHGIRIYNSSNALTAQFDGDELTILSGTITGATIIGSTFKTATSGERIEIDSTNGLRSYNSSNVLIGQFKGNTTLIADASVTTAKIDALAVTAAKVATNAIDTANIINAAITAAKVATNAIDTANIINAAVTDVKVATDAITTTKIADNQITTPKLVALSVTAAKIAANTITAGQIAAGTITATEIAANTITAGQIAALTITAAEIAANTITAGKLSVSTLSAISADLGTITAGSIDSAVITGGTITGTAIATMGAGNNRVTMDSTNGLQMIDSGDVTRVQLNAAVYAGILLNGLRSIDANDIFLESADQSCQMFVSSSSARVSFVASSVTRGYFDASDGSGAGNQPTSLVIRVNGSLRRVNYNSTTTNLYL